MRILQVNKFYYPWIGGVETVARDIAEHYDGRDGISVVNLVCQPHGGQKVEKVNGVQTYRAASLGIVFGMPLSFDFFRLFRKLIKDSDVIILHHPFPLAFVAFRLFGRGKRVVVWYHSDIVRQRVTKLPFLPFIHFALRRAEHIFVSNRAIIQSSSLLHDFSEKCRVIYFGVDLAQFRDTNEIREQAKELREAYGVPLVLAVGRLIYYKGFLYLIAAMKDVPAHLLIVGSGPMREALDQEIAELHLEDRIHIIDSVPSLVPYYYACDVFALPSSEPSEVFGIVQVEAMACGKPVVNTDLPTGVPEVSVDGVTGRTVPAKNAGALSAALNEILLNADERKRFSETAVAEVAKRFTKEGFFAELNKGLA